MTNVSGDDVNTDLTCIRSIVAAVKLSRMLVTLMLKMMSPGCHACSFNLAVVKTSSNLMLTRFPFVVSSSGSTTADDDDGDEYW